MDATGRQRSPIDRTSCAPATATTDDLATSSCTFTGLDNGTGYTFTVRAHNAVGWSAFSDRSRSARPDDVPGPVSRIGVTKTGNHGLSLAWRPPTTRTSRIEGYWVEWDGGRRFTKVPSVYVSGLSNGRGYYFTVYAVNAQGPGTAVQAGPFQSAADPAPPKAPTVRAVPSASGETADLVVSWPEVAPNGPSPVTYNVYRNNSAYAGCLQVSVRSCTVPQVPYDGATHTFAVQAVQGSYRSDVGPATSWKAVTLPARWGDWSWDATGRDREVEIRFTVPDSHGSTSEVSIIVDGDSAWKGELEGIRTRTISVGDNDEDHVVKLRVCNESEACTDSASQQVRAYGPLMPWHIEGISAEYDGTRVRWRVSVDTNGASARVRIGGSDRPDQTFVLSSGWTRRRSCRTSATWGSPPPRTSRSPWRTPPAVGGRSPSTTSRRHPTRPRPRSRWAGATGAATTLTHRFPGATRTARGSTASTPRAASSRSRRPASSRR